MSTSSLNVDGLHRKSGLVAPDTNNYLHLRRFFDDLSWAHVVDSENVCLVVPEITVRGLDRQKTDGKNVPVVGGSEERFPGRARNTVKKLRGFLRESGRIIGRYPHGITPG